MSKKHPFSKPVLGQRTSPFLQEKLIELGVNEVFGDAAERATRLLGIDVNYSQLYRCCQNVSEAIQEEAIILPSKSLEKIQSKPEEVLYGMVDGSMVQLDGGWQEAKVGRVFKATQNIDNEELSWKMEHSTYVAKRGQYGGFTAMFEQLMPPESQCKKVFITDAAQWICLWIAQAYPYAIHILDLFHVLEKLGGIAPKDGGVWLAKQKALLLESKPESVIVSLRKLERAGVTGVDKVISYFETHKGKMDYKNYRALGLMVGSGPIESAHRTVLQVRMKRSGQRWAEDGCDKLIKLRVLYKNSRSQLVRDALKHAA